ncbi:MAG: hydantoinase/oxoprolinase family protein, partial [Deltaproteobacteria bacterium]|nr:hydantoinase/oxoprolinase family protein [Deltaproteobacteria bacterium]
MLLGIDVGGTHTDAVIIGRGGVVATAKAKTDHDDLIASLRTVLRRVLQPGTASSIRRINLSTTLTTNAIVEGKLERVGVLAVSGPGLSEPFFNRDLGDHFHLLPGSIDHRGTQREALDKNATAAALADCRQKDIRVYAAVTKFSPRNPDMEMELAARLAEQADFTSIGHRISGNLNFPRRLATAYYNSAVWRGYNSFADAMAAGIKNFNLDAPLNILKADGGTIAVANSRLNPVQ